MGAPKAHYIICPPFWGGHIFFRGPWPHLLILGAVPEVQIAKVIPKYYSVPYYQCDRVNAAAQWAGDVVTSASMHSTGSSALRQASGRPTSVKSYIGDAAGDHDE